MNFLLRKFLILLALSVAVSGTAIAKDQSTAEKSKLKSGLFSKKGTSKKTSKKGKLKGDLFSKKSNKGKINSKAESAVSKKTTKGKLGKKTAKGAKSTRTSDAKAQYKDTIVNINKASASALSAMLVGIGPVKAKEIVAYRKKNGNFSSLKDLMKVDGIGEATFAGLKRNVSLTRGETKAPEGYKMGDAISKKTTKKSTLKKKKSSLLGRKKLGSKGDSKPLKKVDDSPVLTKNKKGSGEKMLKKKSASLKLKATDGNKLKKKVSKKTKPKKALKLKKIKSSKKVKKTK